ncbi:MAG: biopolymer transporter ExbD [Planctomycetota bacterium]|nr:biopolymer transporter ExbD [Planctomycetota bacterium]
MGYDERQQANSSGTLVAIIGVGLVLAILAIVAVAGVGLFWVRAARMESRDAVVAELQRAGVEAHRAEAMAQLEQARIAATPDPRLDFVLEIDREGNASSDGESMGLDELRAEIAKLKDETSNLFRVRINADPDCPVKHVVPVLEILDEVGDINVRIVASKESNVSADESKAEK